MQLCDREALQSQPSKWGFGQETSFLLVFAISEHGHRFVFHEKVGFSPSPARAFGVHAVFGQVFASERCFRVFQTPDRQLHYTDG